MRLKRINMVDVSLKKVKRINAACFVDVPVFASHFCSHLSLSCCIVFKCNSMPLNMCVGKAHFRYEFFPLYVRFYPLCRFSYLKLSLRSLSSVLFLPPPSLSLSLPNHIRIRKLHCLDWQFDEVLRLFCIQCERTNRMRFFAALLSYQA